MAPRLIFFFLGSKFLPAQRDIVGVQVRAHLCSVRQGGDQVLCILHYAQQVCGRPYTKVQQVSVWVLGFLCPNLLKLSRGGLNLQKTGFNSAPEEILKN